MNKIMEQAIAIKDDIVSYRRTIHSNPEVGTELPMTKKFVMDKLKDLDPVAYVRFASVYREFKDANTFMDELKKFLK